jgi:hypothetical protein
VLVDARRGVRAEIVAQFDAAELEMLLELALLACAEVAVLVGLAQCAAAGDELLVVADGIGGEFQTGM